MPFRGMWLLAAIAASLLQASTASRMLRTSAAPLAVASEPVGANASEARLAVEVPVLVVIVDDASDANSSAKDHELEPQSPLTPSCQNAMADLRTNQQRASKAEKCEQERDPSAVLQKLSNADLSGATAEVEETFKTCGNLTESCAKEVAPHIVMMLRMSGMTVTDKCKAIASDASTSQKRPDDCHDVLMQSVFKKLQERDIDVALNIAHDGLGSCAGLPKPCDFQFAPVFVTKILQAIEQRQMQEEEEELMPLLLSSLVNASVIESQVKPDAVPKKATKAVSLVKVSQRLRIQHSSRTIAMF